MDADELKQLRAPLKATGEQIATLAKLTERDCVVARSLRQPPTFSISRRA